MDSLIWQQSDSLNWQRMGEMPTFTTQKMFPFKLQTPEEMDPFARQKMFPLQTPEEMVSSITQKMGPLKLQTPEEMGPSTGQKMGPLELQTPEEMGSSITQMFSLKLQTPEEIGPSTGQRMDLQCQILWKKLGVCYDIFNILSSTYDLRVVLNKEAMKTAFKSPVFKVAFDKFVNGIKNGESVEKCLLKFFHDIGLKGIIDIMNNSMGWYEYGKLIIMLILLFSTRSLAMASKLALIPMDIAALIEDVKDLIHLEEQA